LDSAAGTAKNGRDKKYQAIYQLRGKILNTNNIEGYKMINSKTGNKEISDLVYIVTGKKNGLDENFNLNDLKYNKIVALTDADSDG
jgi:DNA gyrase/topoisomerase IV subunit B